MTIPRTLALPSLLISTVPVQAALPEAVVDGVRFRIPFGTAFLTPPPNGGVQVPDQVQAAIDGNARGEGAGRSVLFATVPVEAGAFRFRPMTTLVVRRLPHDRSLRIMEDALARMRVHAGYVDGVAMLDQRYVGLSGDNRRDYLIRTGIDFAPEAWASCAGYLRPCTASVSLGERMVLLFGGIPNGELDDIHAFRGRLAENIPFAVPNGPPVR